MKELKELLHKISKDHIANGAVSWPDMNMLALILDQPFSFASQDDVRSAFIAGYEKGHDDTVESRYGYIEETADDYIAEFIEEQTRKQVAQ